MAVAFFFHYIAWHYGRGVHDLVHNWGNVLWFFYNFFSIPLLLGTLFMPFHRLSEGYRKGIHLEEWASVFLVNILMRLVGAAMRLFLILIGLLFLLATIVGGIFLLVVWLCAPLFVITLIGLGLTFLAL